MAAVAQADDADAFRDHLAAGEFAPARRLAQSALPGPQRDAMFGELATALAASGQRRASLAAAGSIGDDMLRGRTLGGVGSSPVGGGLAGGSPEPDFEALIELITTTVEPDSWQDVGGPGAISPFETGVRVDASGAVRALLTEDGREELALLHSSAARPVASSHVRRTSPLRKVSLARLERAVQLRLAAGHPLDPEMLTLAGLERVKYVLLYPESRDLVLAGPAADWQPDVEGRLVSVETNHPVLRLDDLVTILRLAYGGPEVRFGCLIAPRQEALAQTKAFLDSSRPKPLWPGQRDVWLGEVRGKLGPQDVEFYGIDPRSRVARVIFEADYRMKLVGIGLEDGVLGVPSYLASVQVAPGESPPPLGVLRWWFTINYDAIAASPSRDVYEFRGQGVKVQSENERLAEDGQRIHTGKSEPLNQLFAQNFTKHFAALAEKYPVYGDLQNVYDLALLAALLKAEDLPGRVGWQPTCFVDAAQYPLPVEHAPLTVESVINHRVIRQKHILAAVSGGVRVDPTALVEAGAIEVEQTNRLASEYERCAPVNSDRDVWWWD